MAKQTELERRLTEAMDLHAKGVLNDEDYAVRRAAILSGSDLGKKNRTPFFIGGCLILFLMVFVVMIAGAFVVNTTSGGGGSTPSITTPAPFPTGSR